MTGSVPPTVVVAEGSPVVRALLRSQLEATGWSVVEAGNGDEAIAAAIRERPDVILLDAQLAPINGHDVLRLVQEDPDLAHVPIVLLGPPDTADVVTGLRLGAHDYVRKPFDPPELVARIVAALRVKRTADALRQRIATLDALARLDPVTELSNRRHLEERLWTMHTAGRGRYQPVGLVLAELDDLDKLREELGQATADAVLRAVAGILRGLLRGDDVPGRWADDTFLVLLPVTPLDAVRAVGERLRAGLTTLAVDLGERQASMTASIGCASGSSDDPHELVLRCQAALALARERGRGQVAALDGEGQQVGVVSAQAGQRPRNWSS